MQEPKHVKPVVRAFNLIGLALLTVCGILFFVQHPGHIESMAFIGALVGVLIID